jgi:tetratricopeptide (TPR) repeat protein
MAHLMMKVDDKAVRAFKQAVQQNPNFLPSHVFLAAIHSRQGNNDEARTEVAEVLRISPNYTLERFAELIPIADQAIMSNVLDNLRNVGLR